MRDIIEPLFKAKWAIVLTVAITPLGMPGGAMAQNSLGLQIDFDTEIGKNGKSAAINLKAR